MLGQYTFGLKEIPYTDITSSAIYYGNAVGGKADASEAGAIDFKAGKQFYSNKARFNIFALADVLPVDNDGTKGVVTITPTVTTAGAGTLALKVAGKSYNVPILETDTDAAAVVTAIKGAIDDEDWEITGTSTAIFTQKKAFAYTYSADDWAGTFTAGAESSGAYSTSASKTTDAVAPTVYGVTFTLQHCDTVDGTFEDLVSAKVMCPNLEAQGTPAFEITVPSNCKRFVRLKVQGDASATAGALLVAVEPKN